MIIIVYLQYGVVLFNDDFNRTEGSAVGNSWTNIGPVSPIIEDSSMKVVSNSLQGVRRDFTSLGISSGIYYVSFDWKINSNNWLADAFPNGTVTYLRHDYEGNLYYDNTSDFSNPITIGSLALNTWANFRVKVNIDTDRFSLWINNTLVADNIAGLAVSDLTRFTFRAGSGATVTQYIDNFIVYNDSPAAIPTNLTAIGAVNDISLSWTGSPQDFLTYKIYRKTTSPADVFLAEVPGTQTSYTDLTASASTDYFYRVKAVSMSTIESGFSNEATAHLQPDISVSPQVIDVTVGQGYTGDTSFTIANIGNYPLNWYVSGISSNLPSEGLVAYYPFDGNTNDESSHGYNLTNIGASLTTDRFGNPNNAYHFDGSSYLESNTNIGIGCGDVTIAAWYKPLSISHSQITNGDAGIASTYDFATNTENRLYHTGSGVPNNFGGGVHRPYVGVWGINASYELGEWYHMVYTKTNQSSSLYINGLLVGTTTPPSVTPATATSVRTRIGMGSATTMYNRIIGDVDDVLFYNTALSATEITAIYNHGSSYIAVNPTSGSLAALEQELITLSLDATNLPEGIYADTLYVNSNDPNTPSVPVIVNLTVVPGDIVVAPTQFTIELNAVANTNSTSFNITNTGLGKLGYSIYETDDTISNPTLPIINGFTAMGVFNGHSYYQSTNTLFWHEAKTLCEQNNGHLATISNQSENDFIFQNTNGAAWIGFTDEVQEGVWTWITNEPISYTNWYTGEPNAVYTGEDYAYMEVGVQGRWFDARTNVNPLFCCLEIDNVTSESIMSFNPTSGIINSNSTVPVMLSVNGNNLADGIYQTSAMIVSNAPEPRDTLYVPVTVKVDYTPPTAPLGLAFDEVQSDMNQIYLSWTANALADSVYSYKVFRRGLHDTLWSLKGTVDADHNWFIDNQFTGLDTTAVYYKLTAVDWVDNESAASDEVMAWLQRFPAPTGLTMEIIRDRHVQLTWNPVTQTISGNPGTPSCYVIYRSNTPSPIEDFYFVGAVDATTFTHNWAAWFIEIGKQFYVVTAYSGNFEDLRAVAESRSEWKYGELERAAFDYLTNIKRTK